MPGVSCINTSLLLPLSSAAPAITTTGVPNGALQIGCRLALQIVVPIRATECDLVIIVSIVHGSAKHL